MSEIKENIYIIHLENKKRSIDYRKIKIGRNIWHKTGKVWELEFIPRIVGNHGKAHNSVSYIF